MFLYAIDAMILIGFRDIFGFGFHLVALFYMFNGLREPAKVRSFGLNGLDVCRVDNDAYERKVSVSSRSVEPIADDKFVRYGEADIVDLRALIDPRFRLVEESGEPDGVCPASRGVQEAASA